MLLSDPLATRDETESFEDFVRAKDFPCVGAKSALSKGQLKVVSCWDITSAWSDVMILRELVD